MKTSEFRKLIREEIKNVLKEEDSFGDDIAKQIQAERLAQQRKFIAWAKATAAKQNTKLNFNGDAMVTVSLSKLEKKNMVNREMLDKWKAAPEGSEENDLWQGLTVLLTRYKILR
jgi:hypothetical protein